MADEKELPEEIEAIIKRGIDSAINRTVERIGNSVATFPHKTHQMEDCCCCTTLRDLQASIYRVAQMREWATAVEMFGVSGATVVAVRPPEDGETEH